jgi:hypothetical protein
MTNICAGLQRQARAQKGSAILRFVLPAVFAAAVLQALTAIKYTPLAAVPVDLRNKSIRRVQQQLARRQQAAVETLVAYETFLDAAPHIHRHKPAALYHLAYIPLREHLEATDSGRPAAELADRCQELYDEARSFEAQLPVDWLPVNCAVRDKVPGLLAELRLAASGLGRAASTSNAQSGTASSRAGSSSHSTTAAASRSHAASGSGSTQAGDASAVAEPAGSKSRCNAGGSSSSSSSNRAGASSSAAAAAAAAACSGQ